MDNFNAKSAYFSKSISSKNIFGNPPRDVFCQTLDLYDKKPVFLPSAIGEFANNATDKGVKYEINLNFFLK